MGWDTAAIPMQMPPMPQMIQHVHVPVERFMVVNSHVVDSNIPMQMSPVIQHVHVPVERVRIVEVPKYVERRVVKVVELPLSLSLWFSFLSLSCFAVSHARAHSLSSLSVSLQYTSVSSEIGPNRHKRCAQNCWSLRKRVFFPRSYLRNLT